MSLKITPWGDVPELTARIAAASFPKGNPYLQLRDQLGPIFQDEDFSELFPQRGQPALSPWRLALITLLQFSENLSDRQAAESVRSRIDWKYVLGLELDDSGFEHAALCKFRLRLLEHQKEHLLFDKILQKMKELRLVGKRETQRSDSTHILAVIRELNLLELFGETVRSALNSLATVCPEWLKPRVPESWWKRYEKPWSEYHLPKKPKQREELAIQVGKDGHLLLDWIYDKNTEDWFTRIPAVESLRQIWLQYFYHDRGQLKQRPLNDRPPNLLKIRSPYDKEATFGKKRHKKWIGYKVHLTETCEPEKPKLITNVLTTCSSAQDVTVVEALHQSLQKQGLLPRHHLVDKGYTSASVVEQSRREHKVEIVGPVAFESSWQALQSKGFSLESFQIDWNKKYALCPKGKKSICWRNAQTQYNAPVIRVHFSRRDCIPCTQRHNCTTSTTQGRRLTLRPQREYEVLQKRRKEQKTKAFQEAYRIRSGVEGAISQAVSMGMRRSRYAGSAKTHLQHLATAAAINIQRALAWLRGDPCSLTRISKFSTLAPVI